MNLLVKILTVAAVVGLIAITAIAFIPTLMS